jgi:hypothetical protein
MQVIGFHTSSHISMEIIPKYFFLIGSNIFQLQTLIRISALIRINPSFIGDDQDYGWSQWQSDLSRGSAAVRFFFGIAGSNPARGVDARLLWVLCVVR